MVIVTADMLLADFLHTCPLPARLTSLPARHSDTTDDQFVLFRCYFLLLPAGRKGASKPGFIAATQLSQITLFPRSFPMCGL